MALSLRVSTRSLANASDEETAGYAYEAWGRRLWASGTDTARYLWQTKEWDATISLHNSRARMYDQRLGRFPSRDPTPIAVNPYVWPDNSPALLTDPTGAQGVPGGPSMECSCHVRIEDWILPREATEKKEFRPPMETDVKGECQPKPAHWNQWGTPVAPPPEGCGPESLCRFNDEPPYHPPWHWLCQCREEWQRDWVCKCDYPESWPPPLSGLRHWRDLYAEPVWCDCAEKPGPRECALEWRMLHEGSNAGVLSLSAVGLSYSWAFLGNSGLPGCGPESQCVQSHGPIPAGTYQARAWRDPPCSAKIWSACMRVTPDPMCLSVQRSEFFIHNDLSGRGKSQGCIVLPDIEALRRKMTEMECEYPVELTVWYPIEPEGACTEAEVRQGRCHVGCGPRYARPRRRRQPRAEAYRPLRISDAAPTYEVAIWV